MRQIAVGPTEEVFTAENLQKTYGGRLNIVSEVAEAVAKEIPEDSGELASGLEHAVGPGRLRCWAEQRRAGQLRAPSPPEVRWEMLAHAALPGVCLAFILTDRGPLGRCWLARSSQA